MNLPDNAQNIVAYAQGYEDGMRSGRVCGFHDALVDAIHVLTGLLKECHEKEREYSALQEKARRECLSNMPAPHISFGDKERCDE